MRGTNSLHQALSSLEQRASFLKAEHVCAIKGRARARRQGIPTGYIIVACRTDSSKLLTSWEKGVFVFPSLFLCVCVSLWVCVCVCMCACVCVCVWERERMYVLWASACDITIQTHISLYRWAQRAFRWMERWMQQSSCPTGEGGFFISLIFLLFLFFWKHEIQRKVFFYDQLQLKNLFENAGLILWGIPELRFMFMILCLHSLRRQLCLLFMHLFIKSYLYTHSIYNMWQMHLS